MRTKKILIDVEMQVKSLSYSPRNVFVLLFLAATLAAVGLALMFTQSAHADDPPGVAHRVTISPAAVQPGQQDVMFTITVTNERQATQDFNKISAVYIDIPNEGTAGSVISLGDTHVNDVNAPEGWECAPSKDDWAYDDTAARDYAWFRCVASAAQYYIGAETADDDTASPLTYTASGEFSFTGNVDARAADSEWIVTVREDGETTESASHNLPLAVDQRPPRISTITLLDAIMPDGVDSDTDPDLGNDGSIDQARLVFNEVISAKTVKAAEWTIDGKAFDSVVPANVSSFAALDPGTDSTTFLLNLNVDNQSEGTAPKDVRYRDGGSVKDIASLALRDTADDDITEIDFATPQVTAITAKDADGNGKIDQVVVSFSEPMDWDGAVEAGFTVAGYSISSAGMNDEETELTLMLTELEGDPNTGLDAAPDTTYNEGPGSFKDDAKPTALELKSIDTDFVETDGAPPIVKFDTVDKVDVPQVKTVTNETIMITFTEAIAKAKPDDKTDFSVDHHGFHVDGNTVAGAMVNMVDGPDDDPDSTTSPKAKLQVPGDMVTLTLTGELDADAKPEVMYTPGSVADGSGNMVASFTATAKDGIGPTLLSVTLADVDGSGDITEGDTLTFAFDEPTKEDATTMKGIITAANIETFLPILGPSAAKRTYGSEPTVEFDAAREVLTVTVGPRVNIETKDTVDPADSVTDEADNPDITVTPLPDVVEVSLSMMATATRANDKGTPDTADDTDDPVAVNALKKGDTVMVNVDVTNVDDLDTAAYTIMFGAGVLTYVSAASGTVSSTPVVVAQENPNNEAGSVTIVQNVDGTSGVSGTGHLAQLTFEFTGNSGQMSPLVFADVTLGDSNAKEISINLTGAMVSSQRLLGDANGDGDLNAFDVTAMEMIVAGLDDSKITDKPSADANEDDEFSVLDITATETLVGAGG